MRVMHFPAILSRTHVWALVIGVVIAALAIAALTLRLHFSAPSVVTASGTIEVTQSDVAPKVQGRLVDLRVKDGDPVRKGQVVAVLEQLEPTLGVDQARANVTAAKAQLDAARAAYRLQAATYTTTVAQANDGVAAAQAGTGQAGEALGIESHARELALDQADAQLASAQSAYDFARVELTRTRSLVGTGDEPRAQLDDATNRFKSAAAQLQSAKDAVALAQANRRNVQIRELAAGVAQAQQNQSVAARDAAAAQSDLVAQRHAQMLTAQSQLAQARAALALAQDQLRETRIVAPFDGFVLTHTFERGDLIGPGAPVMTIGDLTHPYLYVYVSETDVARIRTGMHAQVAIDGLPGHLFTGTVTEIGNTAEFTPENVQTKEQRVEYLVFRVKIQFTDTSGALKPGLPADATIAL